VLVCLTQEAYNKFSRILRPGGLLITDTRHVQTERTVDAVQKALPMYQTVMDRIGKPIVFNICMLGAVTALTGVVRPESIMEVLKVRISENVLEMNRQALDIGLELGIAAV
jgi:2-oxoglutarate ferredoxin oxidoreductase subunit gamma